MSSNYWQGRNICLRAVEPSDWETHYAWDQDSEMARGVDHIWFPRSREAARRWAEELSRKGPQDDYYHFVIENLGGEEVGLISTHACDRRNGTFEYGLGVRREHQRKGYAGEAIRMVVRYYFEELRYQKVTVHVYSFNEPSIKLHQRLGFKPEGRLRRMIYSGGAFHDDLVFGLTAEEFAALAGDE